MFFRTGMGVQITFTTHTRVEMCAKCLGPLPFHLFALARTAAGTLLVLLGAHLYALAPTRAALTPLGAERFLSPVGFLQIRARVQGGSPAWR